MSKETQFDIIVGKFIFDKIETLEKEMAKNNRVLIVGAFFKLEAFENYPKLLAYMKRLG